MSGKSDHRSAGFTLLEVIVSFAALAITVPIILQLYSTAFGGSGRTEVQLRALLEAKSKIAEFSASSRLRPGLFEGVTDDGAAWRVSIVAHRHKDDRQSSDRPIRAYRIEVSVGRRGQNFDDVTLRTIRLVRRLRDGT